MKLTHLTIDNLVGIETLDVDLSAPVAVFAGRNGVGKSSIREAIRAAFLGMPDRVAKKKDLVQLVHDGAKHGSVVVDLEGGQASFVAPKGEWKFAHDVTMDKMAILAQALLFCLEPAAFAHASADDRRNLLFALTGASSKPDDIVAAMRERDLDEDVIAAVRPMMRAGFPGMARLAEERCRDAKAAWKAVTNEAYGHIKAAAWAAPVVDPVDPAEIEKVTGRVEGLERHIADDRKRLGAAEQRLKTWLAAQSARSADEKTAARLEPAQAKLAQDNADLQRWADEVQQLEQRAGTGPRVGLVHDLARVVNDIIDEPQPLGIDRPHYQAALAVMEAYEVQYGAVDAAGDPEAAEKLPEARKARDLMQRAADNDRRDIEAAQAAAARLAQPVERGSEKEVDDIREFLRAAGNELAAARQELAKLRDREHAVAKAQDRTTQALAAHHSVQVWQAAIDALSPAGIPADILGKCLGPLNLALADLCVALNFPRVEIIDDDISIHAYGRPYALLSGSERWRVDAQIALALAELSGLRLVALDQFDILDLPARADCIAGLDRLAATGKIDTALVFGTFKRLPNFGTLAHVAGWWIDGGRVSQASTEAIAA